MPEHSDTLLNPRAKGKLYSVRKLAGRSDRGNRKRIELDGSQEWERANRSRVLVSDATGLQQRPCQVFQNRAGLESEQHHNLCNTQTTITPGTRTSRLQWHCNLSNGWLPLLLGDSPGYPLQAERHCVSRLFQSQY